MKNHIAVFTFSVLFFILFVMLAFPFSVYADECSSLLLTPIRPNCTINPATKQGLFCGGNSPPSNCNVGGNQNILYTCQCDAQGQNCHRTASQDCSQLLNNGICHVVGNPLFPDYCISFDVNPKTIGPNLGCTLDAASNFICSETISVIGGPAGAQISWSGTINGLNGAILNPATGTVTSGNNQTSILTIPQQFCQTNPTAQGTVVYADINNPTKNNVTVTFSCAGTQPPGNPYITNFEDTDNGNPAQLLSNAAPYFIGGAIIWLIFFH